MATLNCCFCVSIFVLFSPFFFNAIDVIFGIGYYELATEGDDGHRI